MYATYVELGSGSSSITAYTRTSNLGLLTCSKVTIYIFVVLLSVHMTFQGRHRRWGWSGYSSTTFQEEGLSPTTFPERMW